MNCVYGDKAIIIIIIESDEKKCERKKERKKIFLMMLPADQFTWLAKKPTGLINLTMLY